METSVTSANRYLQDIYGEVPASFAPRGGCFMLLYFASGLMSAAMRLASGRVFHRITGILTEGYMFLVPPGATLDVSVKMESVEASVVEFRCPQLRFNVSNARYGLACPDGSRQAVKSFAKLSSYDVALLRPIVEDACKNLQHQPGGARHLFGTINFHLALSKLFVIPRDAKYWGTPGVILEKTIEANPVTIKVKDMARRIGCTPAGLRKSFKALAGLEPSVFKRRETLHFARYWILETRLPFKTIAERMGFRTASYFTRYIAHHTGKTPRQICAAGRWP